MRQHHPSRSSRPAPVSQSPASRLTLTESAKPRLSAVPAASITTVVQNDAGKTRGVTAVRARGWRGSSGPAWRRHPPRRAAPAPPHHAAPSPRRSRCRRRRPPRPRVALLPVHREAPGPPGRAPPGRRRSPGWRRPFAGRPSSRAGCQHSRAANSSRAMCPGATPARHRRAMNWRSAMPSSAPRLTMRTVPERTAGHHCAAAAGAASSRCAGAATAMPLPGSPLRSAVASAARMPAASEGASTTRPPSSGNGSPADAALHDARNVAEHHQSRSAVAGHPHQIAVPARFRQDAVVDRERRAPVPEHRLRQHFQLRRDSLEQGDGHHIHRRRLRGRRPKARNRHADGGGRKAAQPRVRRAGPPSTTGPGNTSLPVRSRHPAPPAASERAMRSARTTPPPISTSATNRPSACTTSP